MCRRGKHDVRGVGMTYTPEEQKAYTKEIYRWRKEHGICTRCGQYEATRGTKCVVCAADYAEKRRNQYHSMSEAEKQEFLSKKSERMKALRKERKEKGLCYMCGKPVYKNFGTCYEHWLYRRNYNRKRQAEKRKGFREIGKCRICGKHRVSNQKLCEEHLQQYRKSMAHAEKFIDRKKKRKVEHDES